MAPKKENSKKVAGNARKAEEAARKQALADQKKAAEEADKWSKGAKSNAKKEAAEAKKAEAARRKAERDAQLKEEEGAAPAKPKVPKSAQKKYMPNRPSKVTPLPTAEEPEIEKINNVVVPVNSSGYDVKKLEKLDPKGIERHPERRYKAALALYEERRLPEVEKEYPGLRKNQRLLIIKKEFERHPENPFNQLRVAYNASLDDVEQVIAYEKSGAKPDLE